MSEFKKAIQASDVPPGTMKTVDLDGEQVLLVNVDGEYFGIGAICKHEEWDLSEGSISDHTVICAGHGTIWDLKTGKGDYAMTLEDEPLYDVKEEDGYLHVRKRG